MSDQENLFEPDIAYEYHHRGLDTAGTMDRVRRGAMSEESMTRDLFDVIAETIDAEANKAPEPLAVAILAAIADSIVLRSELEAVGWGEASSEWVDMTPDGVGVSPAISFTDEIEPRPDWAEFAVYRIREGN